MNKLNKDVMSEIIKYLPNQEVFYLSKISLFYNKMFDEDLIEYIKYRKHPIVFNIIDNYCNLCNMSRIFLLDQNLKFIKCNHL